MPVDTPEPSPGWHKGRKRLANTLLNKQKDKWLEERLGEWTLWGAEAAICREPPYLPTPTPSELLNKKPGSGCCPPACLPLCVCDGV